VISENAIAQTEKLWDIARERLIHGLGAPGASSALTLKKSSREVGVKTTLGNLSAAHGVFIPPAA
jgi:hypothetical protein